MTYNRITAEIGESRRITTRPISYQYDTVQILMLTEADGVELPSYFQVDFCVIGDTDTVTIVGSLTGGAPIPDSLLQQGENLMAYLVLTGSESDVQTRYEITIPVNERPTRSGIEMTSEQQAQVDSLVAALNDGVTRSETAADEAEAASQAVQDMGVEAETLPEESAATVEKTVDPETGVVTLTFGIPKGKKGNKGDKGNPGETYLLAPSVDTIVKNPNTGTFIPAQIVFTVYKVVNGTSSPYRAAAIVADIFGMGMVPHYEVVNDYRLTVPINSIADTGYVACSAYGNGGIIATITIPCILDGAKGDPGEGVAAGGTTGQFLKKKTGTDYDTEWADVDPGVTSVNGKTGAVTLTASDVGAKPASYEAPVSSVNEKTGAVVLDAGDIGYDGETTYPDASVGKELGTINSALSSLDDAVNDPVHGLAQKAPIIINTASGDIASFADGADDMPIRKLVANIVPKQDLHGQSSPYPAGGGVNKLEKIAPITQTVYGCVFTSLSDGSVQVSGTPTATATTVSFTFPLPAGTYIVSCNATAGDSATGVQINRNAVCRSGQNVILKHSGGDVDVRCRVSSGVTVNEIWKCQIESGSTATAWSPYSNICPISGWQGLEGYNDPKHGGPIQWNQILPEVNSTNWSGINATATISDGEAIVTNIQSTWGGVVDENYNNIIGGHKYLVIVTARTVDANTTVTLGTGAFSGGDTIATLTSTQKTTFATVISPASDKSSRFNFANRNGTSSFAISNPMLFDLTAMFGAGNEPTAEVFKALFPHDYYPYNAGETTCVSAVNGDPYEAISASFGQTVYGGSDEIVSGNGTSAMGMVDLGTLNWSKISGNVNGYFAYFADIAIGTNNIKCSQYKPVASSTDSQFFDDPSNDKCINTFLYSSGLRVMDNAYSDAVTFKAAMSGVQLCYELATPQSFTTTPVAPDTLYGMNNIWVDTGAVSVEYPADTKLYIDGIGGTPDEDMIANDVIASGKYFMVNNKLYLSTAQIAAGAMIIPGTNCTATNLVEALNALNS